MIAPTTVPTTIAANTPFLLNVVVRKAICPSGSIHITTKYEAMTVSNIDAQFPMLRAFCTLDVSSLIVTNHVPTIENTIPSPQITIGNRIGDIPPNASLTLIS